MGWYRGNSGDETHPVARKEPNAWGLYDMHGNVLECCQDEAGLGGRVRRGGSWRYVASSCSASGRGGCRPDRRHANLGFRLALPAEVNRWGRAGARPPRRVVHESSRIHTNPILIREIRANSWTRDCKGTNLGGLIGHGFHRLTRISGKIEAEKNSALSSHL